MSAEMPRLVAVELRAELSTGATRPCVMACLNDAGDPCGDYVVKLRAGVRGGPTGLAFEYLAARLAERLSISMPPAALVEVDEDLAAAMPDAELAKRLRASAGLNFGTRFLAPGYVTWPVGEPVPVALRQAALEIMAFDALIDNPDRRRKKPNLLWRGEELLVIDHELAFAFTRLIGNPAEPFSDTTLDFLKDHPLWAGLRGVPVDLGRFVGELESLRGGEVDAICRGVPAEFGSEYQHRIRDWLKRSAKRTKELGLEIGRILR